jgi:LPXTG-motif cell wall-anchored protein
MVSTSVRRRAGRRLRYVTRGAALILTTVVLLGLFAVAAYAHHVDVVASVHCDPLRVEYTATAWDGPSEASRTNPNIGVWYSVDGGATFVKLPNSPAHAFNAANNFSFSDSFTLGDPPPATVIVRTRAQAAWADGNGPGQQRETGAIPVSPCPTTPTTESTPTTASTPTTSSSVTIASTPTSAGTPVSAVSAETATSATNGTSGTSGTLPVTGGGSPIWLAAVAIAALFGGIALIGRHRVRR